MEVRTNADTDAPDVILVCDDDRDILFLRVDAVPSATLYQLGVVLAGVQCGRHAIDVTTHEAAVAR